MTSAEDKGQAADAPASSLTEVNPTWLWTPPEGPRPDPPVVTRPQVLPFDQLAWENFERLCLRLAARDGEAKYWQRYGTQGQVQQGIDIYVRLRSSGRYVTWQCKRYQRFTAGDIEVAVEKFLDGDWAARTETFHLAVTIGLGDTKFADMIEAQATRLREHGVAFVPLGIEQLSERLKQHPDLVDDFFDRAWVEAFCGREAAAALGGRRLRPDEVVRLRRLLRQIYRHHFDSVDPGLPAAIRPAMSGTKPLSLESRYVIPDILETRTVTFATAPGMVAYREADAEMAMGEPDATPKGESEASDSADRLRAQTEEQDIRRPIVDWLVEADRTVLLGGPGVGKSSFLRFVALDLLSDNPTQVQLTQKWGSYVPVWVPFPMWSRMVSESEEGGSLPDLLRAWLHKAGARDDIWPLVEKALSDDRLLLLVDGLDEWSSETAARTTVRLLQTFVGDRKVSAVATSRPLGYERLGGMDASWRVGELAPLAPVQQEQLAHRWFAHHGKLLRGLPLDSDDSKIDLYAQQRAKAFCNELRREPRLAQLAGVPLLLSGLIALRVVEVQMPVSRFLAYEQFTKLLLRDQPRRREEAAMTVRSRLGLTEDSREKAFARLAYEVHRSPSAVALEKDVARDILKRHLEEAMGKEPADAYQDAEALMTIGAEAVGVLVEKSAQEIGFLHRAFQEFLAAKHLVRLPFDRQRELIRELCGDPQWHDVILCLFYLTARENEVDQLVADIEQADFSPVAAMSRQEMLAEVTFGDLNCSSEVAKRLGVRALTEIETGTWKPLRIRLLDRALDGLQSDVMRREVEDRIKRWFPGRLSWRRAVYSAMATWPPEPEVIEVLWRGLIDEEGVNRESAAAALAKLCGGDAEIGARLIQLAQSPREPGETAAALDALWQGWPGETRLSPLLETATQAPDLELRLTALRARAARGEQAPQDREKLLELARDSLTVPWGRRDYLVDALLEGWPGDSTIKRLCLESIRAHLGPRGPVDLNFAAPLLVKGYPGDEEVAETMAKVIQTREYLGFGFHDTWELLCDNFREHSRLVPAIESWLEREKGLYRDGAYAALTARSPKAKAFLLRDLQEGNSFWAARALLDGWGMQDKAVARALREMSQAPAKAQHIAHLLPRIVDDRAKCRNLLLDILRLDSPERLDFALFGLAELGVDHSDAEVLEVVFAHDLERPGPIWYAEIQALIEGFGAHPRVKEIARRELTRRDGQVATVARVYAEDPEMRREVLAVSSPLPAAMRRQIADRLGRIALDDEFALGMLREYDDDAGGGVKTTASIEYYRALRDREEDTTEALARLSEDIRAVGPDLEERRQAALAGLVTLDRLDVVAEAKELRGDKPADLHAFGLYSPNVPLLRHLAHHWDRIETAFGKRVWERLGSDSRSVLDLLATHAADEPKVKNWLIERLEAEEEGLKPVPPAALRLLARERARSDLLREHCVRAVMVSESGDWYHAAETVTAAEILGREFGGDAELGLQLEEAITSDRARSGCVIALCEGWSNSAAVDELHRWWEEKDGQLLVPAQIQLLCARSTAEEFLRRLGSGLQRITGDNIWDFLPNCIAPLVRRLEKDEELCAMIQARLNRGATPAEKTSLPKLLGHARGHTPDLRDWCTAELGRQFAGETLPEIGLDIFAGRLRPVAHVLLDVLSPLRRH